SRSLFPPLRRSACPPLRSSPQHCPAAYSATTPHPSAIRPSSPPWPPRPTTSITSGRSCRTPSSAESLPLPHLRRPAPSWAEFGADPPPPRHFAAFRPATLSACGVSHYRR